MICHEYHVLLYNQSSSLQCLAVFGSSAANTVM